MKDFLHISNGRWNFISPSILQENSSFLAKIFPPLQDDQERDRFVFITARPSCFGHIGVDRQLALKTRRRVGGLASIINGGEKSIEQQEIFI